MSRLHLILLVLVLVTWIPAYAAFFRGDLMHWWHVRRDRKVQAKREQEERLAAEARLRDELAAKYYPGGSGTGPHA